MRKSVQCFGTIYFILLDYYDSNGFSFDIKKKKIKQRTYTDRELKLYFKA